MAEVAVLIVLLAMLVPLSHSVTMVQEVKIGETAVLKCPSNDDNHRFQFWHLLRENIMIGPNNKYNNDKYKYEVLTGTLMIRGVSTHENGLYTCVCIHITDNSYYPETVELVVMKDWEDVYENDPLTNSFRVIIVIIMLLILIALVLVLYNMRPDRSARFRALADEESPDEAGPSYKPPERQFSDLDSHGLDTELPKPTIFTDVRLNDTGI